MRRKPTRDVWAAAERLRRAALREALIVCWSDFKYGGSIAGDLLAVLAALRKKERGGTMAINFGRIIETAVREVIDGLGHQQPTEHELRPLLQNAIAGAEGAHEAAQENERLGLASDPTPPRPAAGAALDSTHEG